MSPGILNLTLAQGETWSLSLTWTDDAGSPISLAGYTAAMQVRVMYDSATPVLSLASGSGITLGGAAGTVAISVDATTTAALPAAIYVYDLELRSAGGTVTRLVQGNLTVTPEVTR